MRIAIDAGSSDAQNWIVINSHPHAEALALDNLRRQDFTAYCPMVQRRVRHARRVEDKRRPLFPGYLFVQLRPELRWRPLLSTYGVRSVVRSGEQLGLVDDGLVSALKAREVDGVIVRPDMPYELGQEVRITGGALDGLVATIIGMRERERLIVLVELLNRPVRSIVEARHVTPNRLH